MKVAIQGQAGSFHDEAAKKLLPGKQLTVINCPSFTAVFDKLASGQVDYGVVAVENSLYGSIHETYDQLLRRNFPVVGEITLKIHQQLAVNPGAKFKDITEVYSHPAALDQCRGYLQKHLPNANIIEHEDTAGAIELVALSGENNQAAIGSEHASQLHGLQIIATDIEDEPDNVTRFILLSHSSMSVDHPDKASLIIATPHQPGALHDALGVFAELGCNLTKLESRPVRGQPFRYQFIIETMVTEDQLPVLVASLEAQGSTVTLLGHYKN